MRAADALARRIDAAAEAAFRIRPLSRTEPHVFAEEKDAVAKELRAIAAALRNEFGGPAGQYAPIQARPGDRFIATRGWPARRVLVQTGRRAA